MSSLPLPGQTVIPKGWGESMVIYSLEDVAVVVDGAPVGPNGRLYKIPANKPTKVPYEVGRYLLGGDATHFPYISAVTVDQNETETGIQYDVEKAKHDALERSKQADAAAFHAYVGGVREDYLMKDKPVPQPPDNILRIVERRGYDLKRYGIVPMGWEDPDKDKRIADLERKLADLTASLEDKKGKK